MQKDNDKYEDAATVILLTETEAGIQTLLLRRNAQLRFAGGNWVFPGGRIDASDFDLSPDNVGSKENVGSTEEGGRQLQAAKNAAVRETLEETGLKIASNDLLYFSRWTPPPVHTRRFNTRFFLAAVAAAEMQKVSIDGEEIHAHRWVSAEQGLAEHAAGRLAMLPPTYVSLVAINRFERLDEVFAHYRNRDPFFYNPQMDKSRSPDDPLVVLYEGDAGYASADASMKGERHRVVTGKDGVIEYFCDTGFPG